MNRGTSKSKELAARANWSELMARAQDGDRLAYTSLLESILPYLRMLAARNFSSRDDAEDAVQDILLCLHAIRHSYDPRRPFGPWLVTIARRRIADRLRRAARTAAHESRFCGEPETFRSDPANLNESSLGASDHRQLHQAVDNLPPTQRRAVKLLRWRELSLIEAARETGMSVTALKVAMHRALKRLRSVLLSKEG